MRFQDLPLSDAVQRALEAMGFEETTEVQEATIPPLLEGRDVIAQAQTGTGKTAAFGVPLVEAARAGRRAIVLTPTRELAKQVQRELQAIGKGSPVDVICLIGGAHFGDQVRALQRHPGAAIVCTPGRVVDHLQRGTLDLSDIGILVLDEADEMLSMGFQEEVDAIVAALPKPRQSMLFSATLAKPIEKLAQKALNDPVTIKVGGGKAVSSVTQCFAEVAGRHRVPAIRSILEAEQPRAALLFGKTRVRVQELADALRDIGAEALHGGMGQPQRDTVMRRFRDGTTSVLVATDVAARGLDVDEIDLVLHDDLPQDADTYVHRIGRTGRAGREGKSILFIAPGRMRKLGSIRHVAGRLDRYTVPGDEELAALRAERVVAELREVVVSDAAWDALRAATATGLKPEEVAARALQSLISGAEPEAPPEAPSATMGLALKVGNYDNVRPGAIVGLLINAGGLRPEDIGRVDILDKMSVAEIPAAEMDRVCQALERVTLSGRKVLPRPAEDWRFKTAPKR